MKFSGSAHAYHGSLGTFKVEGVFPSVFREQTFTVREWNEV